MLKIHRNAPNHEIIEDDTAYAKTVYILNVNFPLVI